MKYPGEGGNYNPDGMPAVCPALRRVSAGWQKYIAPVKMTRRIQLMQWELLQRFNPAADTGRYTQLYHTKIALTNGNGFGDPKDPRINHITGENVGAPDPKLMDGIIMAGQLYSGVVEGDALVKYPGYHAMDANNPVDADTIASNGWMFRAVSWHEAGRGEDFFPLFGGAFMVPHIISEPATYPLEYFEWWDREYPPDPLKVGG